MFKSGIYSIPRGVHVLVVLATDSHGWEHVSVVKYPRLDRSLAASMTPSWKDMCEVKSLLWKDPEACVMQLHPAKSEYVNNHPNCLHLWRPINGASIPQPPSFLVGIKDPKK